MHERAKHFSIHHLFLLLKVQFIKCSAAARGEIWTTRSRGQSEGLLKYLTVI